MFEVNDDFEVDADFLDKVFASEKQALEKPSLSTVKQLPECYVKQTSSDSVISKECLNSTCRTNVNQNLENFSFTVNSFNAHISNKHRDRNQDSFSSSLNHENTPKRCSTSDRVFLTSKNKRQRKFPGPAGLLPERSFNNSWIGSADELLFDDSFDIPAKDELCSQSTLSGSVLEDEPWQSFVSDLGSQQEILKVLNIASIKKKAAVRLLSKKKVPFLAVVLHFIDASAPDPCIILRDTTGEIHGTLHRNVWNDFGAELKPGCVIVLRNVGVLSTGFTSRRHYLNITANNLVTLYTPQGKVQISDGISLTDLNFLQFIKEWKTSVDPVLSPLSMQVPPSLFNTSLLQSNSPGIRNISPQIRNVVPRFTSGNNLQPKNAGPRFVSTPNNPQLRSVGLGTANNFHMRSTGSKSCSTFGKGISQNPDREQHLRLQNPSVTVSSNTVYLSDKSLGNCGQQQLKTSINVKNSMNQMKSNQSNCVPKQSQDMFSSNSIPSQRLEISSDFTEENVNSLGPSKKPKMCLTDYNLQSKINCSFGGTNGSENVFSLSDINTNVNTQSDSQSSIFFTRALDENEKSVVQSVLDGFDSEALFDDF